MKKKILFVVDERQMGGVSTVLNDMLHLLDRSNLDIDVLVLHNRGDQLQALPEDVKLRFGNNYFMGIDYTLKEALKSFSVNIIFHKIKVVAAMKSKRIAEDIKKQRIKMNLPKYDVEIAFKDGFTAIFTAAGNTKKKIHWLHYEYHECNPNAKYEHLFHQILSEFDTIVGVSENVLKAFNELYHLESKSIIIPNVVNEERINTLAKEKVEVFLNRDKINFVCVGRLHEVKAYDRLLQVLSSSKMRKFHSHIHVDIYGDGPEEEKLSNYIEAKDLQEIVHLKGRVDNPYALIKNYDASLVVSKFEAFGLSVVESMLLQVPVLATRTAAVDTLIEDGINGLICGNNERSMMNMLSAVCENRGQLKSMKEMLKKFKYPNEEILHQIEMLLTGGGE